MIITIYLISILISIPGFLRKSGNSWWKCLLPIYNIYLFFYDLKFSPILLLILSLGIIFSPIRMFFLTFLLILLPFIICNRYAKNNFIAFLTILLPFIVYPYIAYFGGTYVYEELEEKKYFSKHIILFIVLLIFSSYFYFNFTMIVPKNKLIDENSIHYVNDLYMSDARIYNNYLTEEEKKLYMKIFNSTKEYKVKINLSGNDYKCNTFNEMFDKLSMINDALIIDHPELMNYAGFSVELKENNTYEVKFSYAKSNPILIKLGEIKIKRDIYKIKLKTQNMSDEEKIKYIYELIGDNNTYDSLFTYISKNQSIYNVFIKHNAVCAGFAKASQVIFQNIGIDSMGITGTSTGPHMWNIIKINNKYYYYDSTVAVSYKDKENTYYYDGLKQETMNSYVPFRQWYPKIETKSLNFE